MVEKYPTHTHTDIHVLVPGPMIVTSCGKVFAGMNTFTIFEMGDYPGRSEKQSHLSLEEGGRGRCDTEEAL